MKKTIGVLAIHGSVIEHIDAIRRLGHTPVEVRAPADLDGLDGLILPGGESTTIGDLCDAYGLTETIKTFARRPNPPTIFGTCAGLILIARWGLLNVEIDRNAYGRQIDSFETDIEIYPVIASGSEAIPSRSPRRFAPRDDKPFTFPAIFIRAPKILKTNCGVRIAASYDGAPVLVQSGSVWGGSFHPELTGDDRIHRLIFGSAKYRKRKVSDRIRPSFI